MAIERSNKRRRSPVRFIVTKHVHLDKAYGKLVSEDRTQNAKSQRQVVKCNGNHVIGYVL